MLEVNNIYNIDCLKGMQGIKDKSIDMILCDLPYGTTQNKWDCPIPLKPLWQQDERIIKDNGVIALFAQTPFDKVLGASNLKLLKYEWIWEKQKATGFLNARVAPLKAHENILIFYKKAPEYNPQMTKGKPYDKGKRKSGNGNGTYGNFNTAPIVNKTGDRFPRSVIRFKTADNEGEIYHPTQKPLALSEYLIRTYTSVGDTILDNCIGSGTTAVACMAIGRNFLGFELNPDYCRIANDRIKNVQLKII